jgi:hypothetical protein
MLKEREIDSERSETRAATSAVNERAAELTKLEVRLAEEAKSQYSSSIISHLSIDRPNEYRCRVRKI